MMLMEKTVKTVNVIRSSAIRAAIRVENAKAAMCRKMSSQSGQGTTEYAILVGVLVVIAIGAIFLFKPTIEKLWENIKDSINKLG
jgi:Flp pilus assembly pilin Flp